MSLAKELNPQMNGKGRRFPAIIKGGALLAATLTTYENLFAVSENDTANKGAFLSNMANAGKLGDQESFDILKYEVRIGRLTATALTAEEVLKLQTWIASARLQFYIMDNDTRVLDLPLIHFANIITGVIPPATAADGVATTLPTGVSQEISIPQYIGGMEKLARNSNFKAKITSALATPAGLDGANGFYINFLLVGVKTVAS